MKLDYTISISRIFQEMSLAELETLHQLCELERTQILQSLALAVLKIPYAGYLLSGNRSNFLDYEGNILWFYTCTKKVSPLYVFEDKRCYKRIPIFYKNKVHFVDTLSRRTYFWDTAVPCGSENSHNVVQLNPDEDKYYLLTPYPILMQSQYQISSTIESSNPPTPTPSSAYTASLAPSSTSTESSNSTNRAYRTFKRKFPNHPFPTKPGTAREYINHPNHTNTKDFLAITLPSFPQYTLNTPNNTNDTRSFVDEQVLMPTLHWTSYYHFTNPLCLPLSNTHIDIERNKDMLYRLTTPLTHRQFTYIGYKKSLKTHTAPRANEYTLEYYDHNIIRANQDQFLDDDRFANPQITEKFLIKTPYVFTLNKFDRKFDHIISEALTYTQAYKSFKEKFQLFSLTFHFLAPYERDLHCSHDIMLRTKQTHTYTYYRFIQNHFDLHTPSRQPHHRFQFINSKYTSPFFLNFTYCIKDTNLHGILRNYDPITQMYIFCPITKTFNAEESRPFLIPHEFIQPIEIPILEFIHNTKYNHKLYNLIQNTPYDFAVGTEELKTIKALQLPWPLLQTKNIIRILAKLITNSDIIHDIFPHGFFPDD